MLVKLYWPISRTISIILKSFQGLKVYLEFLKIVLAILMSE